MGKDVLLWNARFISSLYHDKELGDYDQIHLLGCSVPQEFGWYRDCKFIKSIDTSNTVMEALEGIMYHEDGLIEKPKANMNSHFNKKFEEIDYQLVLHNTTLFREINGIKKIDPYV